MMADRIKNALASLRSSAHHLWTFLRSAPRIAWEHLDALGPMKWIPIIILPLDLIVIAMNIYLGRDYWATVVQMVFIFIIIRWMLKMSLRGHNPLRILLHSLPDASWLRENWDELGSEKELQEFQAMARKHWTPHLLNRAERFHRNVVLDNFLHYLIHGTLLHKSVMQLMCEISPRYSTEDVLVRSHESADSVTYDRYDRIRDRSDVTEQEVAYADILDSHADVPSRYAMGLLTYINHPVHGDREPYNSDNLISSLRSAMGIFTYNTFISEWDDLDLLQLHVIHSSSMTAARRNMNLGDLLCLVELNPKMRTQYIGSIAEFSMRIRSKSLLSSIAGKNSLISDDLELASTSLRSDGFMRNVSSIYFNDPDMDLYGPTPDSWKESLRAPDMNLSIKGLRELVRRRQL